MKPPDFEYARPTSAQRVVELLAEADGDGKVLAGGQSLVPLLNFRLARPRLVVDINGIPDLAYVREDGGWLAIGAGTRTRVLEIDPIVGASAPILRTAAGWVGHIQIRNRGTVGGSIAHADPAAELPAVCVLIDAEVTALGPNGERRIPADRLFNGFLTTTLADDELLTEVRVPIPTPNQSFGFREFAQRRGDFALAGAAVSLTSDADGLIEDARIAVFGTHDRPVRAGDAEIGLRGEPMTKRAFGRAAEGAADAVAANDPRPDSGYRRTLVAALVERALSDAAAGRIQARGARP